MREQSDGRWLQISSVVSEEIVRLLGPLRPLVRGLLNPARAATAAAPAQLTEAAAPGARPAMAAPNATGGQPLAYEQQLAQARTLVSQDPKRVAQVVKSMVAQDE